MNINARSLSIFIQPMGSLFEKARYTPAKESQKREMKIPSVEKTQEEQLIEQFREEQSPSGKRIEQIMGKFRAGKDLTEEELEYLAKNSPEAYKEVREIMLEREQMEQQMKMAKTKAEVAAVCMNSLTCIKETMGTGENAKSMVMKTMARANQINEARSQFVASTEYKEKEDEKTQAEENREKLREEQELLEELEESRTEEPETTEESETTEEPKIAEEAGIVEERETESVGEQKVNVKEAAEGFEKTQEDRERAVKKRKNRRKHIQAAVPDTDIKMLRKKTRELYQNTYENNTKTKSAASSGGVDIVL